MKVETVIGDTAYSEKGNIQYAKENEINLVYKLNPSVTQGFRSKEDEFEFNKDAGMYVCKAGHMAIRKARTGKKGVATNQLTTYYFDIEKCIHCPFKVGCYKDRAKSKTYSVTIKSKDHSEQEQLQESCFFKEKSKEHYKVEAKNSKLKQRHGYVAASSGLIGMELQGAIGDFYGKSKEDNDSARPKINKKQRIELKKAGFLFLDIGIKPAFFYNSPLLHKAIFA